MTKVQIIKFLKWLIRPYIRIRLKDVTGLDGKTRKFYLWIGTLWELHWPGYWMMWYDGPIHHFSLGLLQIYWHKSTLLGD